MDFDFEKLEHKDRYKLLVSTVVPRPIALATTVGVDGRVNAAPYSFFNVMGSTPPILVMGVDTRAGGALKDTIANIRETEQFVVNLVNEDIAEKMNICAVDFPPGTNELEMAGLTAMPSVQIKPPYVKESPVSMECVLHSAIDVGHGRTIVLGKVVHYHIHDELIDREKLYVNTEKMRLIGRMHGKGYYTRTRDVFLMERLTVDDVQERSRAESE